MSFAVNGGVILGPAAVAIGDTIITSGYSGPSAVNVANWINGFVDRITALEAEVERLRFALEYATQMAADAERIKAYSRAATGGGGGEE